MTGWVRLHRGWRDCEAFDEETPLSEREAWLWLIERAAWKPCHRRNAKGERVRIERGQIHISLRALEKAWQWGKNKVARYLERLEDYEMIGTASGQSGTVLTILNYDKYQDAEDGRDSQDGTASGQSRDTHKEGKEGKEEKGTRKRARPSFELPDWIPEEAWKAFEEMRKAIPKVPFTDAAKRGIVSELEKLKAQGHCPEKLLLKAVKKGWRSVFGGDDTLVSRAASDRPMTRAEIERGIRFNEDQGNAERAAELRRQLAAHRPAEPRKRATGPPGQPIGGIVSGIVKQAGAGT